MLKKIIRLLIPRAIIGTLRNYFILSVKFGQYKSIKKWESIDAEGAPVPWYTFPATEYLKQLDFSEKSVFEFGSGNSTLFWATRCKELVSVENNKEWFDKINAKLPENVKYHFCEDKRSYIQSIRKHPGKFDVIIIDGKYRYDCAIEALDKLKDNGFIILDNSDWHEKTSALLRNSDLIEVDLSGFGPINGYTWTTSFYFKRNVNLVPVSKRQPIHGTGSLKFTES